MRPMCQDCRFWVVQKEPAGIDFGRYGNCLRYAPRPILGLLEGSADAHWALWPQTLDSDFCGEFEAQKEAGE
jgi:hypothetical protein